MSTPTSNEFFALALPGSRGAATKSNWELMSNEQKELARDYTRRSIFEQCGNGQELQGHQAFNDFWKPVREVLPEYITQCKGDYIEQWKVNNALQAKLQSLPEFAELFDQAVELVTEAAYDEKTDCGHAPTITHNGPWTIAVEGKGTMCLKCAVAKDCQDVLATDRWHGILSGDGKEIHSLVGYHCAPSQPHPKRTLMTVTELSKSGNRYQWKAVDAEGNRWYGAAPAPGIDRTLMRRFKTDTHPRSLSS